MRRLSIHALACLSLVVSSCSLKPVQREPSSGGQDLSSYRRDVDCKNTIMHKESLLLWNQARKQLHDDLIVKRLTTNGDVYALYDLEIYLRNFLTMTQRCEDHRELNEIVQLLLPAAQALSADASGRKRWICRGGDICRNNNFIGKEVLLPSVQFVGLASSVTNAIASLPANQRTTDMNRFLTTFLPVILEDHLVPWSQTYLPRWQKLKSIPRTQVPANFMNAFDDKDMWMLISISEGLTAAIKTAESGPYRLPFSVKSQLMKTYNAGIELLRARIDKETSKNKTLLAFFDLGAWSRYEDMLFAGYQGESKPLTCGPNGSKTYHVDKKKVPVVPTVNMDISHARRFVPLFEAFLRNEKWMKSQGALSPDAQLSTPALVKAIADGFAEKVMSKEKPLFHTYMDGTNGWYRVDYSSGNACREGDAPYMSSYAGPTGGFGFWTDQNPQIGVTMMRIYSLLSSNNSQDRAFIEKYYRGIQSTPLQKFMFLPTLINAR